MGLDASQVSAPLERFEDGRSGPATQGGSFSRPHVTPKNAVMLDSVVKREQSAFPSAVPDLFGGGCSADLNVQPFGLPSATPTPAPRTQGPLNVPQSMVSSGTPIPAPRTQRQLNVPQPKVSTFSDASRPKASARAQAGDVSSLFD